MSKIVTKRQEDMQVRTINLPTSVLTKCKNKNVLLSVAVSMFIKAHSGDSRYKGTKIRDIKTFFGVGQTKAEKISKIIKTNNKHFSYNEYTDTVVAKTFKNKTIVSYNKHGRKLWYMYAVRLKIDKSWNLKKLETYIHDMLYLKAINATERSDKFYNCRRNEKGILLATKDSLTLTKMGRIGGVCRATAKNHLNRLSKENIIRVTKGELQLVLTSVNENTVNESGLGEVRFIHDRKRNFGYIHTPNEYNIMRRDITESFRNIIFNCKRRLTYNKPTKNVFIMDTDLMAMFD